MTTCLIVSDSFKGTLSSLEICRIAEEVVPAVIPDGRAVALPMADGGEGTVQSVLRCTGGESVTLDVTGPFPGGTVRAAYGRFGGCAVIEMASAAGLPLAAGRLDPLHATTFGVGELIRHAVERGCREIYLGLGGSCTNDGGSGCAAALGVRFENAAGEPFVPTGGTLAQIRRIDLSGARELLAGVKITAMCDVDNPLCGPEGAAAVFGPQKGAAAETVRLLDRGLHSLREVVYAETGRDLADVPGAGAAGGFGFGCMALLGGTLRPGIETLLDLAGFDRLLERADLVITGEGRLDGQSLRGKVISGVARRAKGRVPVIAIVRDVLHRPRGAAVSGICPAQRRGLPRHAARRAARVAAGPRRSFSLTSTLSSPRKMQKRTSVKSLSILPYVSYPLYRRSPCLSMPIMPPPRA